MNIQMILSDNTFPPDIRVKKETKSLIQRGHNVYLLARQGKNQSKNEIYEGVFIERVHLPLYDVKSIGGFLYYYLYRYFLFFPIIFTSWKNKADALHVHDLPLALATCFAGKVLRKPVIFDMHEDYVDMIASWGSKTERGTKGAVIRILSKILAIEELFCVAASSKIIVVIDEEIGRLRDMGVPEDKVVVISNTVDLYELKNIKLKSTPHELAGKFVISYVGGFSNHRGLETLIKALPLIIKDIPNVHLLLVGDGLIEAQLKSLAIELGIENKVTFTGWIPFEEAMSYINASHLCAVPYDKTRLTNKSFPHKICQYMYFKKPILASDVASLARIIGDAHCGIIFQAENPEDLARKVVEAKNGNTLERMGEAGRIAADDKYNWEQSAQALIRIYSNLPR